jgi:hypothetical protein
MQPPVLAKAVVEDDDDGSLAVALPSRCVTTSALFVDWVLVVVVVVVVK